jgi:choline-sulfatase
VDYDPHFSSVADVKRAIAGYSGLVSSLDENIGAVLHALSAAGLDAETRVLYTSDHGDNAGARGLWGQVDVLRGKRGVPLIVAGPGCRVGTRGVNAGVAHRLRADDPRGDRLPSASAVGRCRAHRCSRWPRAHARAPVISEYHAIGSAAGAFMLRFGKVEILSLRRLSAAALRSRRRSRGVG